MNMEEKVLQIPIDKIIPNRFQPRLTFDDNALQELAQSIKEHGIIQPLVLRNLGDKYEIIAGERRYKASQMAGLKTVPAIISDIDDKKSAEVALVENIQRKNLTSIEEARSYKNILDQGYLTQEQLAEKLGISQATVANKLRLLNLADEVQDALLQEKISERHARSLLAIKDKSEQVKWLNRILNERLTVRQLDIELKKESMNNDNDDEDDIPLVDLTPNINEIKENASDINPIQGLHDVESMLKPNSITENLFNLSNPVDKIETLDFDDELDINSSTNSNDILKPVEQNKVPNKFFNFLEDEGANMNEESSLDDIFNIPNNNNFIDNTPVEDNSNNIDDSNNQIIDIPDNNTIDFNNNIESSIIPNTEDNLLIQEPIINNTVNEDTKNTNKFFNFDFNDNQVDNDLNEQNNLNIIEEQNNTVDNNIIDTSTNNNLDNYIENTEDNKIDEDNANNYIFDGPNNDTPVDNNIIEISQENKNKEIFDPMSMVNTLEDDYEEKVEEEEGTDLKTAINNFRDIKDILENKGFTITMEEADLGDSYNIVINIIK